MSRVLLGMSGGIDSTVSAMLLQEQGHELVGVTFRTYDSIKESCIAREKGCCSVDSIMEARNMAQTLGFEHHIVDFRDTFRAHVINNFIDEYMHGRTPNPCVLCNSHIKWGELLRCADEYGCDYIATGHYARIAERNGHVYLRTAVDTRKDQTYFLWMLTEDNLKRTIFPLGGLTKQQVREIARERGFVKLSEKTESQEICFVTNNDYRSFLLENGCQFVPGNFVNAEGRVLGRHEGYACYTIGQRKGLGIALGAPAYVTHINCEKNEVTLGTNDDLRSQSLRMNQLRIRDNEWLTASPQVEARIRYKSPAVEAQLQIGTDDTASLTFTEPVWGITPGQSCVMYKEELVVGGGFIC